MPRFAECRGVCAKTDAHSAIEGGKFQFVSTALRSVYEFIVKGKGEI
jgi:hypothetical protein